MKTIQPAPSFLRLCMLLLTCLLSFTPLSSRVVCQAEDSVLVEKLLCMEPGPNDVLFYARKFVGKPYVAHTLEVCDPECLVVNLRELDCTTFVETVCALALTHRQGGKHFKDYCRNLEKLRYWHGVTDGYCSRLHYFTWWMHDNIQKGLVSEVTDPQCFTSPITVNNHYMSDHADQYRFLSGKADRIREIRRLEQQYNRNDGFYLPESKTGWNARRLQCIHSGDIVAIVTTKAGLDYSHLGFAVWGDDGRLHLLHASSAQKKVVEERRTLAAYLAGIKSSVGIRVLRLCNGLLPA